MKKITIAAAILSMMPAVAVADQACTGKTRGIKSSGLVVEGDTEGKVFKRMGKPDRYVQLENKYGGGQGVEWIYYVDGYNPRTVRIWIAGGKAVRVCDDPG